MNKSPKILIVDDDPDSLMILETYLKDAGYDLDSAKNGDEAWDLLNSSVGRYDLVLLDWMMPGQSGLTVLQRMQKNKILRNTQVIMQTARAHAEEIQKGINAGAWYYLTKPFDENVLLAIVQTALTDRHAYLSMQDAVRNTPATPLQSNRFAIRTLEEAKNLAALLAKLCQNPEIRGLGFLEILLNAIEHGNLGITYTEKSRLLAEGMWEMEINHRLKSPENQNKMVEIYIQHSEQEVTILIKDQGDGFNWNQYLTFDPKRITHSHGRGIAMAKSISFDCLEYRGCGNEVNITVKKPS